jgi:hypothetical protein
MSHTPGPWAALHDHGWLVVQSECESLHLKIAKGSSTQKHMYDARLISAAPELLEALLMVKEAAIEQHGKDFNLTTAQWGLFRAAVAKATGGQP